MSGYLAPHWLVRRVVNPLVMRLQAATTLVVPTRRSGRRQAIPVCVLRHQGAHYLVSVRGESEWVANLRAAGGCELRRWRRSTAWRAVELPVEARPEIIEAYRRRWDRQVRRLFARLPDPAAHPVFRLDPVERAGRRA